MKNTDRRIVLLVGPVPPPWFGQATCVQTLLDAAELRKCFQLIAVDTNNVGKGRVRKVISTLAALARYTGKLARYRPQIVYLTVTRSRWGSVKDCVLIPLAVLARARVVVHLHSGDLALFYQGLGPVWRLMLRAVYRHVSLAVVLGKSMESQFDGLVPAERVRTVFNCWLPGESERLPRQPARAAHDPLRVSFISNILPSKGLYDALEGIAWAVQSGVRLEFRFAGEFLRHDGAIAKQPEFARDNLPARALEQKYEQLLKTLGIETCVQRLGTVTGRQKWELLSRTDILLLPVYNPTEGQPLAAIEAMRAGCALITTRCGGLADIVEEGITGRVVPPQRPREIGAAIKWFADNPGELARISCANMGRAQSQHNPDKHIREIIGVFEEALINGRAPAAFRTP